MINKIRVAVILVHFTLAAGMKSAGNRSPISTATMFMGLFLLMDLVFLRTVFIAFVGWPAWPTLELDTYLLISLYFTAVIFSVKFLIRGKKNYFSIIKANKNHGLKYAKWSVIIWTVLSFVTILIGDVLTSFHT